MQGDIPTRGIAIIIVTFMLWSAMDVATKFMATSTLSHSQSIWIRFFAQAFIMTVVFAPKYGRDIVITNYPLANIARSFSGLGAATLNIYAVQYLPLTVTTVVFFSSPLMVCAISAIFLREPIGWRRFLAILVGFVGVTLALDPTESELGLPMLAAILSAVCLAVFSVLTRSLRGKSPVYQQQVWAALVPIVVLSPVAFYGWQMPDSTAVWVGIATMCGAGTLASYLMSVAHKYASAATLAPFIYSMIIWTSLSSWLLFNEPPDNSILSGAAVVIASGIYLWWRESKLVEVGKLDGDSPARNPLMRR